MGREVLKGLKGKTLQSIKKEIVGGYDYIVYDVTFTDGSRIRFYGNSSADVCIEKASIKRESKAKR